MFRTVIALLATFTLAFSAFATTLKVHSPDKQIVFSVTDENTLAQYYVDFAGKRLIQHSKLGFTFEKAKPMYRDFTVTEVSRNAQDLTWEQPWGEQRLIRDHHNELLVRFQSTTDKDVSFDLRIRAFNDGVGFRYEINDDTPRNITRELTEFWFTDSHRATSYWIPGQARERYEYVYRTTKLQDTEGKVHTPFTIAYDDGTHVAVHEAALVDFAGMSLQKAQVGRFYADLAPRSDGLKVVKDGAFVTPWRTLTIGDEAVDLVNSFMALNLNEPNQLGEDLSWIEPGKYIGIWWCMHIDICTWGSGPKHGATTERALEYMDFAAEYGFDGVLIEGWNVGWDGDWIANSELFDFAKAYPDFDIEKIAQYGLDKGVRLIGHHETSGGITNYEAQWPQAFELYERLGVRQIKTGYVAHGQNLKRKDEHGIMRYEFTDSQHVINHMHRNILKAAEHKISINKHEAVKDTGLRRTYPNFISRESARGQEYNSGWSTPNPPEHEAMLVFTRMLSGPMDYTPGIFNFDFKRFYGGGQEYGVHEHMRPHSTIAKQLAQYVVLYSPIQMAADLPQHYLEKPDAFQFIQDVPTDWETSIALEGAVADYVVFARKEKKHRHYSGNDWYLGAVTDENARELDVALDFLDAGKTYEAQIYRDGDKAHWANNPYALTIEKRNVTAKNRLQVKLASSGGVAVRFKAL
ncbi:MAG: glycoside hydrolase family 97 protein [Glaciecola sp.]|jgi:alpha-glucosidase